jgi:hypothetical protein
VVVTGDKLLPVSFMIAIVPDSYRFKGTVINLSPVSTTPVMILAINLLPIRVASPV